MLTKSFEYDLKWYGVEAITFTWAIVAFFVVYKLVLAATTYIGDRRLTFPIYNLVLSTVILGCWWKSATEVLSGEEPFTRLNDIGGPLCMIIALYATELFGRPEISPMLALHHVVTILMGLYGMTMRNEAELRLGVLYFFFAVVEQPCYVAVITYRLSSPPFNKISHRVARGVVGTCAVLYGLTRVLNFALNLRWMIAEWRLYDKDFWVVWPCFLLMITMAQMYTGVALLGIQARVGKSSGVAEERDRAGSDDKRSSVGGSSVRTLNASSDGGGEAESEPKEGTGHEELVVIRVESDEINKKHDYIIAEDVTKAMATNVAARPKRAGQTMEKFAPPAFSALTCVLVLAAYLLYPYRTSRVPVFHSADGTGNHLTYFYSGQAGSSYDFAKSTYPSTEGLPSPRALSAALFDRRLHQVVNDENGLSVFHVLFGQFISHDAMDTEETQVPITEINDTQTPVFQRTQKNMVTMWLDLSTVYGKDPLSLRVEGDACLLDFNKVTKVDHRFNQSPILSAYHIIFARQHNRLCKDEHLTFEQARDANIVIYQRIVQEQYAPAYTSDGFLRYLIRTYPEYDPTVREMKVPASFSLLYRLHQMMPDAFKIVSENGTLLGTYDLGQVFYNSTVMDTYGLDAIVRGAAQTPVVQNGHGYPASLRNDKFDLAAIDIQRAREMGLPLYQDLRKMYALPPLKDMSELGANANITAKLTEIYGSIDKVEGFVGAMLEKPPKGDSFGKVAGITFVGTTVKVLFGDRLSYPNVDMSLRAQDWTDRLNAIVYSRSIERVLMDTTGLGRIGNAFVAA
ncbi:hypothetical protein HK104_008249 [Borealophlyctis nickersoniae]|nr:hypothetical protein HK104_008249 [Borealophlyctis nickersoniae]